MKFRDELINDIPYVEVLPAAPAVGDSDECNLEVRICPICLKPFRVKTYSRQVTCGDRKCSLVSLRISRAKTTIEKRIKERNKGAALFISKELGFRIRCLLIDGEPWFVAKDVCDALGLTNSRKAVARLDDDEKRLINVAD
ncbi:MAG: Bro-N domain-containing protein, partial [Selenomonadaceae bacterium]|nr:Bro-N domain-containing protein [Selenomonadaceae bacterium]